MKKELYLLLIICIFIQCKMFGQTCNATITADGPTTFCLGDSVQLTSNIGGNGWMGKASFGGAGRQGAASFSIGVKGYVGTGQDASGNRLNDFWEYHSINNTWTQKADFGGTARSNAIGMALGSNGYIGTGFDGSNKRDFWEYDPSLNTWTQKANFGGSFRTNAAAFVINGKGYVGTGKSSGRNNDLWEYDPALDTWTRKANFPGTRRDVASAFSINGKGYIGLGYDVNATVVSDFYEYDPSNDTWTQKADFTGPARMQAVGFGIENHGFIALGIFNNIRRNDLWEYDPETNKWIQKANFPGTPRRYATVFTINGLAYVGLGQDQRNGFKTEFWSYLPSYRYLWSTGEKTRSIIAKTTGDYTVTLSSSTGCSNTSAIVSVVAKPLAAIGSVTASINPICPGTTTTLTANNVEGDNAEVKWYTGPGATGTLLGTGNPLNNAPSGTIYAVVTADCGTPQEAFITITEFENAGITSVTAAANPICNFSTTTLTANGIAGTNAVVNWYDAPGGGGNNLGTGITLSNVGRGWYYARVTADCGAPAEASLFIDTIETARFDTSVTICNSYTWNDSTYKASGDYTFVTTSYLGCDSIATLHLTIYSITSTYTKLDEACFADSTGSITITPTNGTWPYMYRLGTVNNFVSDSVFSRLRAGKYRVTIQDADGCLGISDQITILQTTTINSTFTSSDASCFGTATGSLSVFPTGGQPPFEYKLGLNGTFGSNRIFTNLKSGTYRVFIRDAAGCTGRTAGIRVNQAAPLTGNINTQNPLCNNTYTGSISIVPTNGVAPHEYRLGTSGIFTSNNTFNNLRAGNYRLFIKDNTGCESNVPVALVQPLALSISATYTDATCIGENDGSITVNATGGSSPYLYRFGTSGIFESTNNFTQLRAGSYRIFVMDANGCVGNSVVVTVGEILTACSRTGNFITSLQKQSKETYNTFEVSFAPNPSKTNFNFIVKSFDSKSIHYRITDVNGRVMLQGKTLPLQSTVFGNDLAPGIYMIEIIQGNFKKNIKAVKL